MVRSPDFTREMRKGEEQAVDTLLRLAFGREDEGKLVKALRKERCIAGENVTALNGQILGYFALSYMVQPKGWLCLAPMAIHPEWQRQRTGQRMMGLLTEWARLSGTYVVVLGPPEFYQRGGFSTDRAAGLTSPYPITHTLLAGPGADVPKQELTYPKAFESI